jgi:predicted exporter
MKTQGGKVIRVSLLWLSLALVALAILAFRLQLSFDLSAFFPQKTSLTQEVLLEQLKNGPGSRLVVIGLKGASREQLADYSDLMKDELSTHPAFLNVLNGDYSIDTATIPEPVKSYYLLLDDLDFSQASLEEALLQRRRDLTFGGGSMLLEMMARDPFLQTLNVLERLTPVNITGDIWFASDGSSVLLAETRAAAIDIAAQTEAISAIRQAFSNLPDSDSLQLELTGVGAFSVELQNTIRAEAEKRTILAVTALLVILFGIYRKVRLLVLAALPIAMGFLVGLATVSLVFSSVHGITLAFGFTLMGVAIDYPLHLFSHARQRSGHSAIQLIWPTLRIGAASTAVAYLAIALSGSDGLAQLGIFTASGVMVALLVTRYWLPLFLKQEQTDQSGPDTALQQASLRFLPAIVVLLVMLLGAQFLLKDGLWQDSLSSLSPVPEQRLVTDNLLRAAAGTADMRYQLVMHASSLETLLRDSESVDVLLQQAVADGLLASWQSVSLMLPSQFVQKQRQQAIPDSDVLHSRLSEAIKNTPFREDAFETFEVNVQATQELPPLLPKQFEATALTSWLDSHLIHVGDQWVSLISMSQPNPQALRTRLKTWDTKVELVDLHQSTTVLMRDYRNAAMKTVFLATLVIIALLLLEQKQPRKVLWIALTVMASLAVTIVTVILLHAGLTIIHLVALLLVMGLGLDYALFVSRTETRADKQATRHAVVACAITTTLTFGILAGSSIPMLKFIGLTVATGSAVSFILAFVGSRVSKSKLSQSDY